MAVMEKPFWSVPEADLLAQLKSTPAGLSAGEAAQRHAQRTGARLERRRQSPWRILIKQFNSPIILLLFCSAILSYVLEDQTNAGIIVFILLASGLLSFIQEWSAADAVRKLLAVIQTEAVVVRDGQPQQVPLSLVVPGDIIQLSAGNVIPGDGRILQSRDLFVNESALTGESFPAEKSAGTTAEQCAVGQRTNTVFLGTHVISGTATAVLVATGAETEFGKVSSRLTQRPPESGFERGLRDFGNLLIKVTLCIVVVLFSVKLLRYSLTETPAVSVAVDGAEPAVTTQTIRDVVVEELIFALALAVGMTPQLLPAITSVVMATGARAMAREQVIVKQLLAIENFGSMTVLCSDKTGTLTEGAVRLQSALNAQGQASDRVARLAFLNASLQAGFQNPIDHAVRESRDFDLTGVTRLDEIPYDFSRKRISVLVDDQGQRLMITKGAFDQVAESCAFAELPGGETVDFGSQHTQLRERFRALSDEGFRVLGLACRRIEGTSLSKADEAEMTFLGFLVFADPPKPDIVDTLQQLREHGIALKIITGDNRVVAAAVGRQVGIDHPEVLTGGELRSLSDAAIRQRVNQVDLFAEIEPNQKEQIILALKRSGHVVGFLGDGINDASALHAADVGISVASAVDVAREAAQVVLLKPELNVLIRGVREGRRTFANTLKYVFLVISGNFGYMFSLAVLSMILDDEPLLAGQILMINLLADFPSMSLATDDVDPELIARPRRWEVGILTRFMLTFGLTGSLFDFLTFGVVRALFHGDLVLFHTLWFIESLITGLIIIFVVRTRRPLFQSRPGRLLLFAAISVAIVATSLPFLPFHAALGFTPPTPLMVLTMYGIAVLYGVGMETAKRVFYRFSRANAESA